MKAPFRIRNRLDSVLGQQRTWWAALNAAGIAHVLWIMWQARDDSPAVPLASPDEFGVSAAMFWLPLMLLFLGLNLMALVSIALSKRKDARKAALKIFGWLAAGWLATLAVCIAGT